IASLGKIFRNSIDSFPSTKKYLIDGVAKTKKIKNQLNKSKKLKCGISWKSSNPYVGDEKSIPLEIFLSIFDGVEIELINLQHDINDDEKEFFRKKNVSLIVLNVDLYNDLDETLSLIEACDLVISSSNTIAHMAGSIGKLGAVIIPFASGRFWYWHEIKNTSLWYPSISVFKQNDQGDWSFPIQRANEFLRANFE
ncbi:MAG: hypothetical protein EBU01_14540, partial [Crocinitomicaceae bacterium]|nr:hypothetical protein [Crocinitomicaceae bacterium]